MSVSPTRSTALLALAIAASCHPSSNGGAPAPAVDGPPPPGGAPSAPAFVPSPRAPDPVAPGALPALDAELEPLWVYAAAPGMTMGTPALDDLGHRAQRWAIRFCDPVRSYPR